MTKLSRRAATALALGALLLLLAIEGADAAPGQPHGLRAQAVAHAPALPYLAWNPVAGADRYQVQVAADPAFKAPVFSAGLGDFTTANTRATLRKTLPSHRYWWRVRAASKGGAVSGWATSSFAVSWNASVSRDRSGGPNVLRWRPLAGAVSYFVELSFDDRFGSLVGGRGIKTSAASVSLPVTLPKNTYYWRVTPVDSEGNRGKTSPGDGGWQFAWAGPASANRLTVSNAVTSGDLAGGAATSLFLPQLSWAPAAGAVRYEVEINPDANWATGSRVCCTGATVATSMTPAVSLRSNRYYWRVRGIDGSGNAGAWFPAGDGTNAAAFTKTFGNVCSADLTENCIPQSQPSLVNLHVEDANGTRVGDGATTSSPIVRWDAAPGASSYEYEIVPYLDGGGCWWTAPAASHWDGTTASTAWTPLGNPRAPRPYPDSRAILSTDGSRTLSPGAQYCVRVRAQAERDPRSNPVYGDFTYLPAPAFRFGGFGGGGGATLAYRAPTDGVSLGQMPIFTWNAVQGAASYWVIVAKDPSFTNVVDYAFTRIPAYAPRASTMPRTYADETTKYYWVVLPAGADGSCVGNGCLPQAQPHGSFLKAVPPTALHIRGGAVPSFDWNAVRGARRYRLEVSTDPHFGASLLDSVTTVATSYTATKAYPSGKRIYWRVRADDETLTALTWAEGAPFRIALRGPVNLRSEDRGNGGIPTWRWDAVTGAAGYDLHVELPNGTERDFNNLRVPAFVPTLMTGTGVFRWRVRADFAAGSGTVPGPYSREVVFRRGIWQPTSARTLGSGRAIVLAWQPVLYAKAYRVQISSRRDFATVAENVTTDNPSYAPLLGSAFVRGGRFYWRVAAVDAYSNAGQFTRPDTFAMPAPPTRASASPPPAGLTIRRHK
jgi:hypothetical protein